METFLKANLGKWLAQRSSFSLVSDQDQAGKLELQVDWVPPTSELAQAAPGAMGGLTTTWQGTPALRGRSTLLFIPTSEAAGNLVVQQATTYQGTYQLQGAVLTLHTQQEDLLTEERIWFGGTNLRIRTVTVKQGNGQTMASFFSEIRALEKLS
ncbi:phycobiliprotein lyase [Candidatus Cyanaurora vandensis]|uniref:phycobiliprotein lyase n=1 Tax=Candidatus Cyanaurora vandensis TaxID=2714958 RepID=UPI002579B0C7|nr:phycobiliprotein lyase [Candidatus Cyanaurora vandensis]